MSIAKMNEKEPKQNLSNEKRAHDKEKTSGSGSVSPGGALLSSDPAESLRYKQFNNFIINN